MVQKKNSREQWKFYYSLPIRPKNSFSGTAASLKSSPFQPFLFIVFPDFSYLPVFSFLFYRNNYKHLSDSEYILHQCQSNVCISRVLVMCYLHKLWMVVISYTDIVKILWQDLKFRIFILLEILSCSGFIWVYFQLVQFAQ